jgi:hypothetical protein
LELELKEAIPTVDNNNGTGTTTSNREEREEDVMGVEEGDVNVKVNATSSEAKSAKLAKLVKLAKSTNMWCLSPHVPLSQEARDKDKQSQRKVCPVNLRGEVCMADNCWSKHLEVCLVADHGKGKIPRATCTLWHIPTKHSGVTAWAQRRHFSLCFHCYYLSQRVYLPRG